MRYKHFNGFYNAFEPILFLCKISGITTFSLKIIDNKQRYMVTLCDIIFSLLPCILLNIIFAFGINTCEREYEILIRAITAIMQRYGNILMYLACYFGALINGKRYTKAVSLICKYDGYFNKCNRTRRNLSYISTRRRVLIALSIALLANGILICIDAYDTITRSTPCFCMLLYACSYTITVFMELQMFIILRELKERLKALKFKINYILVVRSKNVQNNDDITKELYLCSNIYNDLIDAGVKLNRYFETQILAKFFVSFLFILSALFYFTTDMQIGPDIGYLFDYVAFIYDFAMNFIEVFVIIYAFSNTAAEADNIANIFFNVKPTEVDSKIKRVISLMIWETYNKKFNFSVFYTYPLEWTTLFAFLCGILTYLLILLQFNEYFYRD